MIETRQQSPESQLAVTTRHHPGAGLDAELLCSASGKDIMAAILSLPQPTDFVQGLACEDFYYLIHRVGADDCLPLLRLAATHQWEYLLDLELWQRDRLRLERAWRWLDRLFHASPARLVSWLRQEGQEFLLYYLGRRLQVVVRQGDEPVDLPPDFFTFDDFFFVRVLVPEERDLIAAVLRSLAAVDHTWYQEMLLHLAGTIAAELEEELFRRRNVRLAEHGFLPFHEAAAIYAPLPPEHQLGNGAPELPGAIVDRDEFIRPPALPARLAGDHLLLEVVRRSPEPALVDRLQLEFAALCNQLLAVDRLPLADLEDLVHTCRRAAAYVNLALESLGGASLEAAEVNLRRHDLISLFRLGFSAALRLRWRAESWLRQSWFRGQGLDVDFWGDYWQGVLSGLLKTRPQYYAGPDHCPAHRDFASCRELAAAEAALAEVEAIDQLLRAATELYPLAADLQLEAATAHRLLVGFFARHVLDLAPGWGPLPLEIGREFLHRLRSACQPQPATGLVCGQDEFVRFWLPGVAREPGASASAALGRVWIEFWEEFSRVAPADLDPRFAQTLWIGAS